MAINTFMSCHYTKCTCGGLDKYTVLTNLFTSRAIKYLYALSLNQNSGSLRDVLEEGQDMFCYLRSLTNILLPSYVWLVVTHFGE